MAFKFPTRPELDPETHISPEIRALIERHQLAGTKIPYDVYDELRMNRWEREAIYPLLSDEALCRVAEYFVKNCRPKDRAGLCSSYDEALTHMLVPLLLKRLEERNAELSFYRRQL